MRAKGPLLLGPPRWGLVEWGGAGTQGFAALLERVKGQEMMVGIYVGFAAVAGASSDDPELARLYEKKAGLEQGIADLRRRKESLSKEEYENQLEDLLIELALANRAIREREDANGSP